MYQLKILVHRTGVPNDPQDNMLLLHAHVQQAGTTIQSFLPQDSAQTTAKYVVNNHVLPSTNDADASDSNADLVHLYAKELLTLALL